MTSQIALPTTIDEWTGFQDKIRSSVYIQPSPSIKLELYICALLTVLSGALYFVSFVKRRKQGILTLERDSKGYWHPNVHASLPIFTILYAFFDVAATANLRRDFNHSISPITIGLQLISILILQLLGWHKIWATLYALPPSPFNFQPTSAIKRKKKSPLVFNFLNFGYLIATLALEIPFIVQLIKSARNVANQQKIIDGLITDVIENSDSSSEQEIFDSVFIVIMNLTKLKKSAEAAQQIFFHLNICVLCWLVTTGAIFCASSILLIRALGTQVSFLKNSLENQKALKDMQDFENSTLDKHHSITSWRLTSLPAKTYQRRNLIDSAVKPYNCISFMVLANTESFWGTDYLTNLTPGPESSFPSDSQGGTSNDNGNLIVGLEVELLRRCAFLMRYWYSTILQSVVSLLLLASFTVLCLIIIINPHKLSFQDQILLSFIWSNWTWGGGAGVVLGLVACIVAFSPAPVPQSDEIASTIISTKPPSKCALVYPFNEKSYDAYKPATEISRSPSGTSVYRIAQPPNAYRLEKFQNSETVKKQSGLCRELSFKYKSDLSRQPSATSNYSSVNGESTSEAAFFQGTQEANHYRPGDWNTTIYERTENEEFVGGYFKAIHGLRAGDS
ncbi:hypothetical protein BY996DRAFT_4577800 [Phakopsora pachyrhizi]|uniref:Expressed protein n=1 Tax=Phakopsora pachyrhizi TaxID=170000 RepID=A0AAV0B6A3_PHAPC|nr:hypothetical protein BY996DRAFT_4577800 [Phakopsora pachyrhizi]CAH7681278.1 expressed protein [Phakopsora pachyrhizi]